MNKNSLLSIIISITAVVCFGYYVFDAGKYIAMYCYPFKDNIREFFDVITHIGILGLAFLKYAFIFAFVSLAVFFIFQAKKEFSDNGEYFVADIENKDLNIDNQ